MDRLIGHLGGTLSVGIILNILQYFTYFEYVEYFEYFATHFLTQIYGLLDYPPWGLLVMNNFFI